ncbi:MAG: MFS transporter, partial [Thermomicrobiales bacterium]|nr:MFS transporter [Thermomicrobiales bacterium]
IGTLAIAVAQRHWGKFVDLHGARATGFWAGLGVATGPIFWSLTPVYWLGLFFECIISFSWPGHSMALTMRSIELSKAEEDRPANLAWTSLAQGAGACLSPLVAAALVGFTGYIPLFLASAVFRLLGTVVLSEPERESWFRSQHPFRRRRRPAVIQPLV